MTVIATLILSSSLSWLAGSWRGQMSGGQIEEVWTPPAGPVMPGDDGHVPHGECQRASVFLRVSDNRRDCGGRGPQVKRFNRAMKGQEEREKYADFKLTKATPDEATFEAIEEDAWVSLLYKRLPAGRMEVHFHKVVTSTGKEQKMLFPFERAH